MELNLRKARKLEEKISKKVSEEQLKTSVSVRTKSTVQEIIDSYENTSSELNLQVFNLMQLNSSRFEIRSLIGQVNESSKINSLMNERESIKNNQLLLSKLLSSSSSSIDELLDLAKSNSKALDSGETPIYSGLKNVTTSCSVVTKITLEKFKTMLNSLTKRLEEIEEELIQKNVSTKITIGEDMVKLLKDNSLL